MGKIELTNSSEPPLGWSLAMMSLPGLPNIIWRPTNTGEIGPVCDGWLLGARQACACPNRFILLYFLNSVCLP